MITAKRQILNLCISEIKPELESKNSTSFEISEDHVKSIPKEFLVPLYETAEFKVVKLFF